MMNTEIRTCEEALRVLAAHLDAEIDNATAAQLERHLTTCRSCYSRAEFERRLKASIAELARTPVPPELAQRVRALMGRFSVAGSN
jgi:anti-sigma factor (TIGR02949 family)